MTRYLLYLTVAFGWGLFASGVLNVRRRSANAFVAVFSGLLACVCLIDVGKRIGEPLMPRAALGEIPLLATATVAMILAVVGTASPRTGPRASAAVLLTTAALLGGLHPFGPFVILWWFADRDSFRRPWWALAIMFTASLGLDFGRDDPAVAGASLMVPTLIGAWSSRPHRGQQTAVSAAFAAVLLLKFGWLTGPQSVREITTAAAVSAVAVFTLAAGRQTRPDRSPVGVAWAISAGLILLAAAAECHGSEASGTLVLAVSGTLMGAGWVEERVGGVRRLGRGGILALTTLLPAIPITTGFLWWPAVADLLRKLIISPMTGVPEPSGSAGLIATLIVIGPLFSAGRWLVMAESDAVVREAA